MSKEVHLNIQAGCRVAAYISDTARNRNIAEIFDVLEVRPDGQLRCHKLGTEFKQHDNRNIFLYEHQLSWCRLTDGREFTRQSTEDKWQDAKHLT